MDSKIYAILVNLLMISGTDSKNQLLNFQWHGFESRKI
jgi:hypothetical protein